MSKTLSLPDDLQARLLAAGVKDDVSLRTALEADPELRSAYEDWLFSSVLHAFAQTDDREALLALQQSVPLLSSDVFAQAVQASIDAALNMGEYGTAEALRQRLDALREIRAMDAYQRQTPLARAVIAFVQAEDDEAARQAYFSHREQLDTDAAAKMLVEDFEANDVKARAHLLRRAEMLQALRAQGAV